MKKGFTLIELLAVILILGILALVAIPVVGNIIDEVRSKAAKVSAINYARAVDEYLMVQQLKSRDQQLINGYTYLIDDETDLVEEGVSLVDDSSLNLGNVYLNDVIKVGGKKPLDGYVIVDNNEVQGMVIVVKDYMVYCESGDSCSSAVKYNPKVKVNSINVNKETITLLVGETDTLTVEVVTEDGSNVSHKFTLEDETIASINKNGVITALKEGHTKIYISAGTKVQQVNVRVINNSLIGLIEGLEAENDSYQTFTVNGESYPAHIYVLEGNQVITENTTFGDINDCGSSSGMAQNMVVLKVNGDLTINSGVTISPYYTEYGGPKGFFIYVTGKLTNNGTIDNSHGAYAEGQNVYLWKNANDTYEYVPAAGAASRSAIGGYYQSANGINGTGRQTGGGGTGSSGNYSSSGSGAAGTSYSGGSGATENSNALPNGGAGASSAGNTNSGGGAGNPGGEGKRYTTDGQDGSNGTGGLLVIYADIFNNLSVVSANGSAGGNSYTSGGGSGGGSINIFYSTSRTKGEIHAYAGSYGTGIGANGGTGGTGTINIGSIQTGSYVSTP